MLNNLVLAIIMIIALAGCSGSRLNGGGTSNLSQLQRLSAPPQPSHWAHAHKSKEMGRIRLTALKDAALSLGARAGLAYRANQIDAMLKTHEPELDRAYNFYGMLLNNDVLPPVLTTAQNTLALDSPNSIRLEQKIYRIVSQARFVTAPPTWRDYLWMDYSTPDVPDNSLLPKNANEQQVWNYYVAKGWKNGIHQANNIFSANLSRLNRDYNGMILYRKLYAQNMVSAPFVVKTDLGITGDGTHMAINDQVLRITALPQLNLHSKTWKPVIRPGDPMPSYANGVNDDQKDKQVITTPSITDFVK